MYQVVPYGWRGMHQEVKAALAVTYANRPLTRKQAKRASRRCFELLIGEIHPKLVVAKTVHRNGCHYAVVTQPLRSGEDLVTSCGVMIRKVEL